MPAFASCRTWTAADIAALSASDISQLNYHEMLELVGTAQRTVTQFETPQVTESDILVRHVYALRQRCRNEISSE